MSDILSGSFTFGLGLKGLRNGHSRITGANADGAVNVTLSERRWDLATDQLDAWNLNFGWSPLEPSEQCLINNGLGLAVRPSRRTGILENNVMSDMFHYPFFIGIPAR